MCVLPAGELARKYGRRAAFMAGTGVGVLTGLIAVIALYTDGCGLFFIGWVIKCVRLAHRFMGIVCTFIAGCYCFDINQKIPSQF